MALIGSAYVEIRALDTNLQRDINNAMKKIKEVTLKIEADVNLAPVRKKIEELRKEVSSEPLKFAVEVEDQKVVDSLAEAHQLYEDNPLNLVSNTDTTQIHTALQTIQQQYQEIPSTVRANADTLGAETQLATLARRRTANIFARLNIAPDIERAIKGIGYTIMGAIPADKVRASVTGVLANFESLAIGASKALAVIGSVGAMALTTGANILTMGGDIGRTLGLLNTAPAIFTAMGLAMVSLKLGFKDFGGAFSQDAKKAAQAMAKLPKEAQAAVKAMKGLGAEIRKDSQGAFWKEMGTSLQDTVKTAFPIFKKGMHDISIATAKMTKGMLASFKELADNGGMKTLLTNITKGLTATSNAVKPFFDAMNTMSVTGSKHLERYGTKLTAAAERFDAWATRVSESGEMDQWITQAGANMHNLGRIIGETVNVFKGLTQAAAAAGGKGLADLAEGMKNVAGLINSEPFQSKLIQILVGAREGVKALGEGFDDIKRIIGGGTAALSGFLTLAGQIGGSFMSNIAAMFDGTGLGAGLIEAMDGAKQAMDLMKPAFSDFGTMLGDIGEIASVLFVNMAPGINNLADTLQKVVAALKKGVEDVIPVFNVFIQNILMVIAPIIVGIAGAVGGLLEGFAALPEIIRNAIMAFGLFLLALKLLNRPLRDTATGVRNMASPLQRMRDGIAGVRDSVTARWNTNGSIGAARQAVAGLAGSASVAAGAIGKAFGQIRWMAGHSAQAIGAAFGKTFSQLGGEMKRMAGPIKAFGSTVGAGFTAAFKDSFAGVGDGFKRIGDGIGRMKDSLKGFGQSVKSAFPASLLGPALKALPGEVGKAMGFAGQKIGAGVSNIAKTLAGPAVGFAMNKMKDTISTQALYASKRIEDIGKAMGTAAQSVKNGAAAAAGNIKKLGTNISSAVGSAQQSMAKAFNSGVLAAAINPMTAPFVKMADAAKTGAAQAAAHVGNMAKTIGDAAKTGATQAASHFGNMAKSIGSAMNTATVPARAAFAGLAVAASIQAGVIADKFQNTSRAIATGFDTAFRGASSTVGRVFTGISSAATTAATTVTDTMRRAGTSLSANFAPAVSAVRGTFEGIGSALRPAVSAVGDLGRSAGTAAGAVGALAGATAKWAGAGLLGALGGGWGLAIAAATAAITAIADAQAKSKARVDAFSASLDQQSGAMTNLTKKLMLNSLFDGKTDAWDDFVRGVVEGSRTVAETLDDLGMDTKKYFDNMADPSSRAKVIGSMKEIEKSLRAGQQVSQELADAAGVSLDALTGLSAFESIGMANSLQHATTKAEDMAKELQRAEEQVKLVAKATGVNSAEAAIMSKNYDILANATSSVSDKFTAFKENLRLVGSAEEKAQLGQKGYQQSLRDTKTKIEDIAKANEGLLMPSLYSVKDGFDFTKQAGADLHTALEGQVSGIQMLGTEAIQKALAEGKKGTAVQEAAVAAMKPGIEGLRETLRGMKFSPEQIQGILDTFNLFDKDVTASISLEGAETVRRDLALLTIAKDLFVKGDYVATLKVLPDEAKKAIEDATGVANGFARGEFEAMLKVLDSTEGGRTAALAKMMTVVNGDFAAELTAMNLTGPTVDAAKAQAEEKWKGKEFGASLTVDPGPFQTRIDSAEARGVSFGMQSWSSVLNADGTPFDAVALAAQGKGSIFDSTTYTSKMAADTAAFEASKNAANTAGTAFNNTTFTSKVDANKTQFDGVLSNVTVSGTTLGQKTWKPTLDANDVATNKIRNVNNEKIADKSFNISAFVNDSVRNIARSLGIQLADGGIINGAGVQTFADGGITAPKVKSYAGGGFENHVAQISRGQTPYRIWSEPETGGEAYIPLSKTKRLRSLKILQEVADQFGYSLVKGIKFANGGIMTGMRANSPSISRESLSPRTTVASMGLPASPTVITHVYPSAGLNEEQVANSVSENIYWKLSTQI